jgi:hypothetical protein
VTLRGNDMTENRYESHGYPVEQVLFSNNAVEL